MLTEWFGGAEVETIAIKVNLKINRVMTVFYKGVPGPVRLRPEVSFFRATPSKSCYCVVADFGAYT